jgi:hydroxyethylthiazole kinase-like uncharacterized protein yjeF
MDLLSSMLRKPTAQDDKYSRGVVGFVTGSTSFPGAAILGVTAAMRTGIGMVRWLGPESVGRLLLEVRPEVVIQEGCAQAWVVGSGVPSNGLDEQASNIVKCLESAAFAVVDAGALGLVDFGSLKVQSILTPHAGELSALLERLGHVVSRQQIESEPKKYAALAAKLTGQTVLLKGNVTTIADPPGAIQQTAPANAALATAGTGDVLAGILGALVAANFSKLEGKELTLSQIAFAGANLQALAADLAAKSGPVVAMDVAEAIRVVVGEILA